MLERTFSFWRRWLAGNAPGEAASTGAAVETAAAERRLWLRYPAEHHVLVQLPDQAGTVASTARISDISRGGANLLWDRQVPLGHLLNLDLPQTDTDQVRTVLACVVRAHQLEDGQWSLGCVFSRELTDDDLAAFRTGCEDAPTEDQRNWQRLECSLEARLVRVGAEDELIEHAQVLNISPSGIGLLVEQFVDAGSLLNLDLVGKQTTPLRTILACVVHVSQRPTGAWALGCNFIRELDEDDFQALVAGI